MELNTNNLRTGARAVADLESGTVLASVDLRVSPERVFRALTTSDVERWWGSPDTYRMDRWRADLRPGGAWSVEVVTADGKAHPASGEFLEVNPPRKAVHTRRYDWDHPVLGRRITTVAYLIDRLEVGSRLTVRHEGFQGLPVATEEHAMGWERVLAWLERSLQ